MSTASAKDLIQAKALGCLDPEEETIFSKLLEDSDFPWQEFGQYQNLVAFLPSLLDIENPDQEVKDDIARKLYEYGEKIKAEEKTENVANTKIQQEDTLKDIEEEGIVIEEETETKLDTPVEEPDTEVKPPLKKGISFKEHGVLQVPLSKPEELTGKETPKQQNKPERTSQRGLSKKEFEKRNVKSYVSKIPAVIEPEKKKQSNKLAIAAIIIAVITLLLMVVFYFKISSDVQKNRDEIQQLREQINSEVIFEHPDNLATLS